MWTFLLAWGCAPTPAGPPDSGDPVVVGVEEGQVAPDFTLPDRQDVPWTLSDHAGDVVVVEISGFW